MLLHLLASLSSIYYLSNTCRNKYNLRYLAYRLFKFSASIKLLIWLYIALKCNKIFANFVGKIASFSFFVFRLSPWCWYNVFLMFKIEPPRYRSRCYGDTMQCFVFNFVLPCWVLWNFLVRWELVTWLANKRRWISSTTNKVWVLGSSLSMTDGFLLLLVMALEIGGGGVKDWCQKEYPSLNFFKTTNV